MKELIKHLEKIGVLQSEHIKEALKRVDRKDFVLPEYEAYAYDDAALPILAGQTTSQPYTVVFMLELLAPGSGDIIFEIGYGSGWQTVLLAHIVGDTGAVHTAEIVPELCEFGKKNAARYPELFQRITFHCTNARSGLLDSAQKIGGFNCIIAAAEVKEVPGAWRDELKEGGRLVYPKDGKIFREIKKENEFVTEEFPGFVFVPFQH